MSIQLVAHMGAVDGARVRLKKRLMDPIAGSHVADLFFPFEAGYTNNSAESYGEVRPVLHYTIP